MATDYDAPRKTEEESPAESLEALQASRGAAAQTAVIDVDDNDTADLLRDALAKRLVGAHPTLAHGITDAVFHMVLDQRPLRVVNDAFNGLKLLREIETGTPAVEHRQHERELPVRLL